VPRNQTINERGADFRKLQISSCAEQLIAPEFGHASGRIIDRRYVCDTLAGIAYSHMLVLMAIMAETFPGIDKTISAIFRGSQCNDRRITSAWSGLAVSRLLFVSCVGEPLKRSVRLPNNKNIIGERHDQV